MKLIKATPLSFIKYGKIVNTPSDTPTSESKEYKFWSNIADYNIEGETEIGICMVYKQRENLLNIMERHLNTPEILIPIDAAFILPVLKEGETDNLIQLFEVNVGESIVINDGIWHGACLPLNVQQSSYFVIFKKGTPVDDVQKKSILPIKIELD